MLENIPKGRVLIYLMVGGLLPILGAWFFISSQLSDVSELQNEVLRVQERAFTREKKQSINMSVCGHFQDADHFYIDKNLETLVFLEPEIESLKSVLSKQNFSEDEQIKKRLEFLTSTANNMVFTEGVVQSTPIFQEVTETLVHPIEINVKDLQTILCRVEGIAIGDCVPPPHRPQLIILDFKLEKKNVSEKNQVFSLNLKLLKREFL